MRLRVNQSLASLRSISNNIDPVRVRFAPSPTGHLHVGGLRTAFYNYLFAKQHNGQFILRIEDTDRSRTVAGMEHRLEELLDWVGVTPDESITKGGPVGPYKQSERLHHYQDSAKVLLDQGDAYPCFCSEKRLDLLRKEAVRSRSSFRYDGRCRSLSKQEVDDRVGAGQSYVIRFKLRPGEVVFNDLVSGMKSFDSAEQEGDPIIVKSDGWPTYHLANVVDDHLMKISHVLRGIEWQVSTPKHLQLYQSFGWQPPEFAHMPLIMNMDGSKVSKRQGDIRVETFKDLGFYPEAVLNFVTLVGGGIERPNNYSVDDIVSVDDLVKGFSIGKMSAHSGKIDLEGLNKLNRSALKMRFQRDSRIVNDLRQSVEKSGKDCSRFSDAYVQKALEWSLDRVFTLKDLTGPDYSFIWNTPKDLNLPAETPPEVLEEAIAILEAGSNPDHFISTLRSHCKKQTLKFGSVMKALRIVLAGSEQGPPIKEIIEIIGRDECLVRLKLAINSRS